MSKLDRDYVRDLIAETFFDSARDTLKMFEEDIARIYKLMEETPVTNETQNFILQMAVTDREYDLLREIIEEAADKICSRLDDNVIEEKDSDWG